MEEGGGRRARTRGRGIDAAATSETARGSLAWVMPLDKDAERMRKAEKEVGENLPEEMKGLDTEDVGDVEEEGADPSEPSP